MIYPVLRLGETLGGIGKPAEALPYFERAVALIPKMTVAEPEIAAHARYELAQSLSVKDRARAISLMTLARTDAQAAKDAQVEALATEWLASHRAR